MLKQSWGVDRPGPVPSPMSIGEVMPAMLEWCRSLLPELRLPRAACLALCMDIKEAGREAACLTFSGLGLSGPVLYPDRRASSRVAAHDAGPMCSLMSCVEQPWMACAGSGWCRLVAM